MSLTDEEKSTIADQLNVNAHTTVAQVFYSACQQGTVVASPSSYYRIARSTLCPLRTPVVAEPASSRKSTTSAPMLVASQPFQTLVWDITYLPLKYRGQSVALHMVLDLYSRSILDWIIAPAASDRVAEDMFARVIADAYQQGYEVEVVHSDNGQTMKSKRLKALFATHDVTMSFSRPHVSDDNPHIESSFSTLKGDRKYPHVFDDTTHAANWVGEWINFYNTDRFHPGLAHFTPTQIRTGTWTQEWEIRNKAKKKLYDANPARYRHNFIPPRKPNLGVRFNVHNTPDSITNRTIADEIMQK